MRQPKEKLRLLYVPFLFMAIIFISGYTFLNWLLLIRTHTFSLKEEIVNLWLPLLLPWIPVLLWLRPRVKLLNLKRKKGDLPALYLFVAAFVIAIPTLIAQAYLLTATGKLTRLNNINQLSRHPPTKFYSVTSYYIDKEHAAEHYTYQTSGKYNQYLDLYLYLACPILTKGEAPAKDTEAVHIEPKGVTAPASIKQRLFVVDGAVVDSAAVMHLSKDSIASISVLKRRAATALYGKDAAKGVVQITTTRFTPHKVNLSVPKAWLCLRYTKQISNRLSSEEKENRFHQFYQESEQDFRDKNLEPFTYLDHIGNNHDRDEYIKAVRKSGRYDYNVPIVIMEPKYEPFEKRNGNKGPWIIGAFAIGALIWLLMILFAPFDEQRLQQYVTGTPEEAHKNWREEWTLFIPRPGYYATPVLMYLNIFVFLLMVASGLGFISFGGSDLLNWGANFRPYVLQG